MPRQHHDPERYNHTKLILFTNYTQHTCIKSTCTYCQFNTRWDYNWAKWEGMGTDWCDNHTRHAGMNHTGSSCKWVCSTSSGCGNNYSWVEKSYFMIPEYHNYWFVLMNVLSPSPWTEVILRPLHEMMRLVRYGLGPRSTTRSFITCTWNHKLHACTSDITCTCMYQHYAIYSFCAIFVSDEFHHHHNPLFGSFKWILLVFVVNPCFTCSYMYMTYDN